MNASVSLASWNAPATPKAGLVPLVRFCRGSAARAVAVGGSLLMVFVGAGGPSSASAQECAPGCWPSWVGDGSCDVPCNVAACSFDGGDCNYPPGDFDNDDDVDLADYVRFADCLGGPMMTPTPTPPVTADDCLNVFDFNADGDVDVADFGAFQPVFGLAGCAPGCPTYWVGDGYCDAACNVASCDYDGGDCNCAPGCWPNWVGNGTCDTECNVFECDYDGGDCYCAPGCRPWWVGDGYCDAVCYVAACGYDGGDCAADECAMGCLSSWVGDGSCNMACNVAGCSYDNGDCNCAPGCWPSWAGDGFCDVPCNVAACGFDGGDCNYPPGDFDDDDDVDLADYVRFADCLDGPMMTPTPTPPVTADDCLNVFDFNADGDVDVADFGAFQPVFGLAGCAPGCPTSWVGDGYCDAACNVASCDYDGGDCNCAPGCWPNWVGNGTCDTECNVFECDYDGGDCYCAPGCRPWWVGDGYCDAVCNVAACNYDNGDCAKR